MTDLRQKLTNALNETRMLVLGAQILIGFQFQAAFREGFDDLSGVARRLDVVGLLLMVLVIALLISPAAFHRIAEGGHETERLHAYTSAFAAAALLPFAIALGLDIFVALERPLGTTAAGALGACFGLVALVFWYGLELAVAGARGSWSNIMAGMAQQSENGGGATPLSDRINHMLTEARVILPGAQALLGFQLVITLASSFEQLPFHSKLAHAAGLLLVALSVILLITPAAYHRIVNRGEDTEDFYRCGSVLVLVATMPLALGICVEVFVVIAKIAEADWAGVTAAGAAFLAFAVLWYLYPLFERRRRSVSSVAALSRQRPGYAR